MTIIAQLAAAAVLACTSPASPPDAAAAQLVAEIGFSPEAMLVAGFSPEETESIVDNLCANTEARASLAALHATATQAGAALEAAELALNGAPSSPQLREARDQARKASAIAHKALAEARVAVRLASVAPAGQAKADALALYLASANRQVSPEFKAISRSDADWAALEHALRAEARALWNGEEVPQQASAVLSAARSNESVIAAKGRLDQGLVSTREAFAAPVEQQVE